MTVPASPLVTARRVGAVAVVTLDRPRRRNALSRELADQLADRLAEVVADGARAIVLAAAGPVFSAGGDLEDLMSVVAEGAEATSAARILNRPRPRAAAPPRRDETLNDGGPAGACRVRA